MFVLSCLSARVMSWKTRGRPRPDNSTGLATRSSVSGPLLTTATRRGRVSSILRREHKAFCLFGSTILLPSDCNVNNSTSHFPFELV